jgi:hypothetical protein
MRRGRRRSVVVRSGSGRSVFGGRGGDASAGSCPGCQGGGNVALGATAGRGRRIPPGPPSPCAVVGWCGAGWRPRGAARGARRPSWRTGGPSVRPTRAPARRSKIARAVQRSVHRSRPLRGTVAVKGPMSIRQNADCGASNAARAARRIAPSRLPPARSTGVSERSIRPRSFPSMSSDTRQYNIPG